jgi:hypothetical protein
MSTEVITLNDYMSTEVITLNDYISRFVGYRIQKYVIDEELFDEESGEFDDYYWGQYDYDIQCLVEIMKQRIEEASLYFKIDNNSKIDYECQGIFEHDLSFGRSPYPGFDEELLYFLEDRLTEELLDFFNQEKENELK